MKLYLVAPNIPSHLDKEAADARLRSCIEPIAELILGHISEDPALFGVRHEGEVSDAPIQPDLQFRHAQAVRLADDDALRQVLVASGDPSSGEWMLIRSLVSCRAVSYGHDGEAFVCLPTDAEPIVSTDPALIYVEERSSLLVESDWMDGLSDE